MQTLDITSISLPEILLWLLTYAIVYGVLQQVNIPKSKSARSIIAIVSGFLVLMSQPTEILAVLSHMAGDMLLVIIGLLVFLVFVEMIPLKIGGSKVHEHKDVSKIFLILLVIIAAAIFVSAGGLELLGWEGVFMNISWNTIFFLLIVIAAIWWMVSESGEEKETGRT